MISRRLLYCLATAGSFLLIFSAPNQDAASQPAKLPTGQMLSPAGISIPLDGTMAANLVRIPRKSWVAVICSGARQSVSLVDLKSHAVLSTVPFQQLNTNGTDYVPTGSAYYGLAASADGKKLYVSAGGSDQVDAYSIGSAGTLSPDPSFMGAVTRSGISAADATPGAKRMPWLTDCFVSGVAVDNNNGLVWAVGNLSDTLYGIPTIPEQAHPILQFPVASYPLAIAIDQVDDKVFVTSERNSALTVLSCKSWSTKTVTVGAHPDALLVSHDCHHLFVANADSDTVNILDPHSDQITSTILLRPAPVAGLPGATPTGLCLSEDEHTLFVTLADMNAVAVVRLNAARSDGRVVGYIPTGWYPSAVALTGDGKYLVVANAKGNRTVTPNVLGPTPISNNYRYFDHYLLSSTLSFIPIPTPLALNSMTETVMRDNALTNVQRGSTSASVALLSQLPIKHVIYIIKENRTYDEVLGDLPKANGDPAITLFGKEVTPNEHALATDFVTLDNFYCCAEVSADGWNWSTSALANEYVQRTVPEVYSESNHTARKQVRPYDYEGENRALAVSDRGIPDVAESPGGYIWDSVKRSGLSYRDYGAFLSADGNRPAKPALLDHTDPDYCYFDLKYADSDAYSHFGLPSPGENKYGVAGFPSRYSAWKAEFDRFVTNGQFPAFELLRLPRDHTAGTTPGTNTPQAMAADNDYAVGEIVDAVSHSPYWKNTAIFVVEDDAQNGPDHVDCHRSTAYVISPYIKHGAIDHTFYNTDSILRTMELLLHVQPMTRFDATATPLATFTDAANFWPYDAIAPSLNLIGGINTAGAFGARQSKLLDFAVADDIPETALNEILWHSIKGAHVPMPSAKIGLLGQ